MVVGNTIADFKTAFGQIYTPNSTLEVSGSVRVTGSLIVSSSNTTTIKGPMFVGEEVATTAWTMAHYGDTDTKWVIDDDDMIYTVGNVQMFRMREDGTSSAITVGSGADDVDFVVAHQANKRILEGMSKRLKIPMERVVMTVNNHGNTSAASIPLAMSVAVQDNRIKQGDIVVTGAIGGGLAWGTAVIRW